MNRPWSFSRQWEEFREREQKLWDLPADLRIRLFFDQVDMRPEDLADCRVLDAGCGPGIVTNGIAPYAREVVGIDLAECVEALPAGSNVRFIRGDLNNPPFPPESFDVVYASGSLHHNRSTEEAFRAVAKMVRPGGRMYVWLYKVALKPIPLATIAVNEPIRWIVSRLPARAQAAAVRTHAAAYLAALTILRRRKRTFAEYVTAASDAITPRYAHRHNEVEVARWFHEAGFNAPKMTEGDNDAGFGVVAVKGRTGAHFRG